VSTADHASRWAGERETGWRGQVAADLLRLAELQDRALRREAVLGLWADCYDGLLGMTPDSAEANAALDLVCRGLTDLPTYLDAASLGVLAEGYADIYDNAVCGGRPVESAWVEAPSGAKPPPRSSVQDWMQRYSYAPAAGDGRTADHLVNQLRFLAHLVAAERANAAGDEVTQFMDQHLLCWIDRFADRVGRRSSVRLYQGLAVLTAVYVRALRDQLAAPAGSCSPPKTPPTRARQPGPQGIQQGVGQ
jgi:hypothetical protein